MLLHWQCSSMAAVFHHGINHLPCVLRSSEVVVCPINNAKSMLFNSCCKLISIVNWDDLIRCSMNCINKYHVAKSMKKSACETHGFHVLVQTSEHRIFEATYSHKLLSAMIHWRQSFTAIESFQDLLTAFMSRPSLSCKLHLVNTQLMSDPSSR